MLMVCDSGDAGQNFTEDQGLAAMLGGRTGVAAVEETLAQYGSASKAPSWLAGMFDTLKGMFGMSSSGSGKLNFEHVIKYEWLSGAQGTNGQHYTYTDLAQALDNFVNAELDAGATPAPQLVRTQPVMRRLLEGSASVAAAAPSATADVHPLPVMRRTPDAASASAQIASTYGWASQPGTNRTGEHLLL